MSCLPPISFDAFKAETEALLRPPPFASKFSGGFAHDMLGLAVKRDWLVKGALLARTFGLVIGPPGCGKSFLMLDLAMTTALAVVQQAEKPLWFGRRIAPCGVIYVSAEGQEDFVFRIRAWLEDRGLTGVEFPFWLIPTAIDLQSKDAQVATLVDEIKAVSAMFQERFGCDAGMVVIDTVNRALAGGDENKSEVMGAFVRNCGQIKEACGVAVIGVHHVPESKEGPMRARGHGSLHGATDTEFSVMPPMEQGAPNKWRISRLKAGPTGAWHEFKLRSHGLGRDEDGEWITSCVVTPLGGEPSQEQGAFDDAATEHRTGRPQMTPDGRVIVGDNLTNALLALQKGLEESGAIPPPGVRIPHGRHAITMGQWLDEICRLMPSDDDGPLKHRERCRKMRDRAVSGLRTRILIANDSDWIWRTDRRVASVDRADLSESEPRMSESGPQASESANPFDIMEHAF